MSTQVTTSYRIFTIFLSCRGRRSFLFGWRTFQKDSNCRVGDNQTDPILVTVLLGKRGGNACIYTVDRVQHLLTERSEWAKVSNNSSNNIHWCTLSLVYLSWDTKENGHSPFIPCLSLYRFVSPSPLNSISFSYYFLQIKKANDEWETHCRQWWWLWFRRLLLSIIFLCFASVHTFPTTISALSRNIDNNEWEILLPFYELIHSGKWPVENISLSILFLHRIPWSVKRRLGGSWNDEKEKERERERLRPSVIVSLSFSFFEPCNHHQSVFFPFVLSYLPSFHQLQLSHCCCFKHVESISLVFVK